MDNNRTIVYSSAINHITGGVTNTDKEVDDTRKYLGFNVKWAILHDPTYKMHVVWPSSGSHMSI
ncbi:MAG: hypothetical protein M3297_11560 [Thermoproteota archaeon]|nr:hypothetical protein [Thermoproteota archaeon]